MISVGLVGVLLTHQHPDHVDSRLIKEIIGTSGVQIIGNTDTNETYENLVTKVLQPGEQTEIAGFSVVAYGMPRCPMPDGSAGPPNNGYVIDNTFLLAGDSYIAPETLNVPYAAVPIAGPDLSLRDARDLIVAVGAKTVIPVHYSIFSDEKPTFAAGLIEKFTPVFLLKYWQWVRK